MSNPLVCEYCTLEVDNTNLLERVKKLEEENEKLRELLLLTDPAVSHIVVCSTQVAQWNEFKYWQAREAAEVNCPSFSDRLNEQDDHINKLEARNKVLEEVREFYADPDNWGGDSNICDSDLVEQDSDWYCGGKRAREAAEVKGVE